ncbi:zinc ribbon domain-containing protein [Granulicatella elegans]|uniref:zinc ribbon domain-containing protein n=1 Tax=Granulicatella elegans TaxID=137732 RepID=UPI00223D0094|nr:recombinase zinc beta ribbon domain-containing protein [Granulicatella elegans]
MVITKSISRFARNTIDCLKYIRQLREKNISIIFEKENINTMEDVKDIHEAIISKDIFIQVQEEMLRRANMFSGEGKRKKRVYSSKYALSSLCVCSKCGDIYRRIVWSNRGERSVVWRCCTRVEHGPKACNASTIKEEELQEVVVKAMNMTLKTSEETYVKLMKNIEEVIAGNNTKEIEIIDGVIA